MDIHPSHKDQSQTAPAIDPTAIVPRLWIVMTAFAVPFAIISFNYFETLERSGTVGAIIADILLPTSYMAYAIAIYFLKNRKNAIRFGATDSYEK